MLPLTLKYSHNYPPTSQSFPILRGLGDSEPWYVVLTKPLIDNYLYLPKVRALRTNLLPKWVPSGLVTAPNTEGPTPHDWPDPSVITERLVPDT